MGERCEKQHIVDKWMDGAEKKIVRNEGAKKERYTMPMCVWV